MECNYFFIFSLINVLKKLYQRRNIMEIKFVNFTT